MLQPCGLWPLGLSEFVLTSLLFTYMLLFREYIGFHNRWNKAVGICHPNVWIFLRKVKDEEKNCRLVLRSVQRGDAPPKRKRKFRLMDKRLKRLKKDYRTGRRSLKKYWEAVSYAIHNFQ
jgi:hypothetical protein